MQLKLLPASCALAGICILVYLLGFLSGFQDIIEPLGGLIPARFYGSDSDLADIATVLPFWITPFSAPFVSTTFFDLLLPVLILLLLGTMIEKVLGWQGVLALFAAGALASAAVLVVLVPDSLRAYTGSYNANSAIIAAYLVLHPIAPLRPWKGLSADQARGLQLLLLWVILNLITGIPTSYELLVERLIAPVGSFAVGLLLARPLLLMKYRDA
jgi:membrane associated rhomboid family serine protease